MNLITEMKKQKENLFSAKFRLLNSQEHTEEIIWSSSESSDFEECIKPNLNNITKRKPSRKRKRKIKVSNNLSNLDITIIDSDKDSPIATSPVLASKTKSNTYKVSHDATCLFEIEPEANNNKVIDTSPVLCTGQARNNLSLKSPIIAQKFASPMNSPKVRKILFDNNINNFAATNQKKNTSSKHFEQDKRKIKVEKVGNQNEVNTTLQTQNSIEFQEQIAERKAGSSTNMTKVDLIRKVKSFFDSHFNSESSSQPSIAETLTPKNISSDDIDILSTITQMNSSENIVKSIKQTNSTDNSEKEAEKSKKMRYKKDGLAYRLNLLLKKHNANISLWQHERFLAENSKFKIPKGEHLVFRIQKVNFNYGCFLLEAMDPCDEAFSILINNVYVNNCVFQVDAIFKLYEPYQIFNLDNRKLIVNVCKFECVILDTL